MRLWGGETPICAIRSNYCMEHGTVSAAKGAAYAQRSEAELVQDCRAGDQHAFAELVRRYKREILRLAARFCDANDEADDLGQEIFCSAYKHLPKFRGQSSFRTWLHRIASNACVDHLRRQERLRQRRGPMPEADQAPCGRHTNGAMESRLDCRRILAHLSPKDRLVITLLYMEGYSVQETADLSGLNPATVRVRAFRAKAKLRKILEVPYGE